MALRIDSQYSAVHTVEALNPVLIFNKTESTVPYLNSIKEFCVTFLQNITHIHTSVYSAGCPFFLPSFFLPTFFPPFPFIFTFFLYILSVPFRLQSIQFISEILFFSETVES